MGKDLCGGLTLEQDGSVVLVEEPGGALRGYAPAEVADRDEQIRLGWQRRPRTRDSEVVIVERKTVVGLGCGGGSEADLEA